MVAPLNLDTAIRLHGGEAVDSVRYYLQLPAVERLHLLKFLFSLRAQSQRDRAFPPRHSRSVVEERRLVSQSAPSAHRWGRRMSGLADFNQGVRPDRAGDGLSLARRPAHLDRVNNRRVVQAEIERGQTLGEVARLAMVGLVIRPAPRLDDHRRAEAAPVRGGAYQRDLEEVQVGIDLGKVADQDHRFRPKVVRDDVEVSVVVDIEHDRRTGGKRSPDHDAAGSIFAAPARLAVGGWRVAVGLEPRGRGPVVAPRLDAEDELAVEESLSPIVQQHRVDPVAEREVHPGGDEDVLEPVGVKVADADAPRPERFHSRLVGHLAERARRPRS